MASTILEGTTIPRLIPVLNKRVLLFGNYSSKNRLYYAAVVRHVENIYYLILETDVVINDLRFISD